MSIEIKADENETEERNSDSIRMSSLNIPGTMVDDLKNDIRGNKEVLALFKDGTITAKQLGSLSYLCLKQWIRTTDGTLMNKKEDVRKVIEPIQRSPQTGWKKWELEDTVIPNSLYKEVTEEPEEEEPSFEDVVDELDITNVQRARIKESFDSVDALKEATKEQLTEIQSVGEATAEQILNDLH